MKKLFPVLSVLMPLSVIAQNNPICVITSVKGDVRRVNQVAIRTEDTIALNSIRSLRNYGMEYGMVTFYNSEKKSSGRAYVKDAKMSQQQDGLFEFVDDILVAKSKTFPSGYRGECSCLLIEKCLETDPDINGKLLVFDTLSFPAKSNVNVDSCFYFLQWKNNGRLYNNRLSLSNGDVILTGDNLYFNGNYYDENGDGNLSLGYCSIRGRERTYDMICSLKINLMAGSTLVEYFTALRKAMQGSELKDVYETYYKDLYVFFGKPNQCRLKKLINYSN
jgi:hypothetical protein